MAERRRRWTLLRVVLALVGTWAVAGVEGVCADEGGGVLATLKPTLERILKRAGGRARVVLERDVLVARMGTRVFKVYGQLKTGQYSGHVHEEEGPDYKGILLRVSVNPGPYFGAAVVPQTLREPYWRTFIDAVPLEGGRGHLWLRLSFGARTDPMLVEALRKAVRETVAK